MENRHLPWACAARARWRGDVAGGGKGGTLYGAGAATGCVVR